MENVKVKNAIISKQLEYSENYNKFIEISKRKNIDIKVVEGGQRLTLSRKVFFDILWPFNNNMIEENELNNNSIVCKLKYYNFSILFTGDIEEIAENEILEKYNNNLEILNSDILKVAHHGSKTSSTEKFLEIVKPKIALIGVGINNNFGHPNEEVIDRLDNIRCDKL